MHRSTWKKWERWWAAQLGGVRVPITGRARGSAPDVEHQRFAIEVKVGRVLSPRLTQAIEQAQAASVGTGRAPLACISHRYPNGVYRHVVLLTLHDFAQLAQIQTTPEPIIAPCDEEPEP